MGSNAKQQGDDYAANWGLDATRKWQRRDCSGAEVKGDSNEVGDRNHLDRLI
jgi:hypothetical protein